MENEEIPTEQEITVVGGILDRVAQLVDETAQTTNALDNTRGCITGQAYVSIAVANLVLAERALRAELHAMRMVRANAGAR